MTKLALIATLLSTSALAACGSSNHAPVAYGTAPTARIYNKPAEIAAEQRRAAEAEAARVAYAQSAYTRPTHGYRSAAPAAAYYNSNQQAPAERIEPAVATSGLAPLTPVAETYREGRFDYNARPVYLAQVETPMIEPVVADPVAVAPSFAAPAENLSGQVTVLAGDTVYAISRRTGASPQAIIALNGLAPPYALEIGQTIRVPSTAVPPSRAAVAQPAPTPVRAEAPRESVHVVRAGDTLYSISRTTGIEVDFLARANRLRAPYDLTIGQTLRIPGGVAAEVSREAAARANETVRPVSYNAPAIADKDRMFDWPVQGAIIGNYGFSNTGKRNDGVNIAAPVGTPVRAAADGEVVYRGSELQGYGNLLLIKHVDGFVTAYAHNDAMLVKKGDRVRKGQVIAKVGQTGSATEPQLHFEVRQNLKAIDPVALLGSL